MAAECWVVYHLVPTSNHNPPARQHRSHWLFIILFLHQTTTLFINIWLFMSCLSSCSYIKPQRRNVHGEAEDVVYHLVPTSNHNFLAYLTYSFTLFIILFLHQTTTGNANTQRIIGCLSSCSYIKPQLRCGASACCGSCLSSCSYIKPQRSGPLPARPCRCLSSCSYIKPQQTYISPQIRNVVYHLVPTSNHNKRQQTVFITPVVYHLVPTSNHNMFFEFYRFTKVVYHLVPTSNHN